MDTHLYLSLIPEALIASQLPPQDFGTYLSVGTRKRTRGEAMFFEIEPDFIGDHFPISDVDSRCIPHHDGEPKKTLYLSIYRVLENVTLNALKNLYLVTDDGRVLEIEPGSYSEDDKNDLHIYQELVPVTPFIASSLNPTDFSKFITDPNKPVSVPKIAFVELILDELATDPQSTNISNLPYSNIDHLKDCLMELKGKKDKVTKTVIRSVHRDLLYRTIKNGFFVGDQSGIKYYPFPSRKDLENKYFAWWLSAQNVSLR